MDVPTSLVAVMVFSASFLTSSATTAKPASGLAGPGRFDGGVQGEQVGLVGDIRNDVEHLADVFRLAGRGHPCLP